MLEDLVSDLDAAVYATLGEPVTPASGVAFNGILRVSDIGVFDAPRVGDYTLRFPAAAAELRRGDLLSIRGQPYRIAEQPRRIGDGRECEVELVRGDD